ncbi:hypothetical protein AM593_06419, partial [Mytilus galloprovincialis]
MDTPAHVPQVIMEFTVKEISMNVHLDHVNTEVAVQIM